MVTEVEVKFLVEDFRMIRAKLRKMRARLAWKGRNPTLYFDVPSATLRKAGKILRLQKRPGHPGKLTLKSGTGRKDRRYKIQKEWKVTVTDFDAVRDILKSIGFVVVFRYMKKREHWLLRDAAIELDELDDGRRFVEIEGSKKRIAELARVFGLDWNNSTSVSYFDLLRKKTVKKL